MFLSEWTGISSHPTSNLITYIIIKKEKEQCPIVSE